MFKASQDNKMNKMLLFVTVLSSYAYAADGQSYLLTLENVLGRQLPRNQTSNKFTEDPNIYAEQVDNNTIIVYKNTVVEPNNELSQAAMDVITIIWYVATFLAVAAFFMLMACSDRRCRRSRQSAAAANETQRAPPTPSPSYSEFAPPSYDTVIKMQQSARTSIFVIPFNSESKPNDEVTNVSTTPSVELPASVYTIDERLKTNK